MTAERDSQKSTRYYNPDWALEYYFIDNPKTNSVICILCRKNMKTVKKWNVKRHYESHEDETEFRKITQYTGKAREEHVRIQKESILKQMNVLSDFLPKTSKVSDVTYICAWKMAKSNMPFLAANFVKDLLVSVAEVYSPSTINYYKETPLSRQTIERRQGDLAGMVRSDIKESLSKCSYFSLCLDESTDVTSYAQLVVFVRWVSRDCKVHECFLDIFTMEEHTTGKDFFLAFREIAERSSLDLSKLASVCTDGCSSMVGKQKGLKARIKEWLGEGISFFHCIIHQFSLCSKATDLDGVVNELSRIAIFIRRSSLRERQFAKFIEDEFDLPRQSVPYYSAVRWLSKGGMINVILSLRQEIIAFYNKLGFSDCALSDDKFYVDSIFISDIVNAQNSLNLTLQGSNKNIFDSYCNVCSFVQVLEQAADKLRNNLFCELFFPQMNQYKMEHSDYQFTYDEYILLMTDLLEEYNDRFADFKSIKNDLELISTPWAVDINSFGIDLQKELVVI